MTPLVFEAFSRALTKLAGKQYQDLAEMRADLEPGDILLTAAKKPGLLGHLVSFRQGSRFGHAALYAGDGNVIDTRTHEGVFRTTLNEVHKRWGGGRAVMALRPRASEEERKKAVENAKEYLGTPYSLLQAARMALPASPNKKDKALNKKRDAIVCSTLITRAYPNQEFAKDKYRDHVMPVDLARSSLTRQLGVLRAV